MIARTPLDDASRSRSPHPGPFVLRIQFEAGLFNAMQISRKNTYVLLRVHTPILLRETHFQS
jgi:hypothetical protein